MSNTNSKAWIWQLSLLAILMASIVLIVVNTFNQEKFIIKINNNAYQLSAKQLTASLDKALQPANTGQSAFEKNIYAQIDEAINKAKLHTQDYVNWHYSITGSLLRMSNQQAQKKMAQLLFNKNSISEAFQNTENQLTNHLQAQLNAQKQQFLNRIEKELAPHKIELSQQQKQQLTNADLTTIFDNYLAQRLESASAKQQWGAATGTGAALALGLTARTLSTQAAAQAGAKAATRGTSRVASLAACTPVVVTGVGAIACGTIVFVVGTAVTEFTLLQIDKNMNGAELKLQLDNDLENIRSSLKTQYSGMLSDVLATDKTALQNTVLSYAKPIDFIK